MITLIWVAILALTVLSIFMFVCIVGQTVGEDPEGDLRRMGYRINDILSMTEQVSGEHEKLKSVVNELVDDYYKEKK